MCQCVRVCAIDCKGVYLCVCVCVCVWVGISGHKRSLCPCLVAIQRSVCVFEREVERGVEREREWGREK